MTTQSVRCAKCGIPIDEALDSPAGRRPCPSCGATTRAVHVEVPDTLTLRESIRFKRKDSNGKALSEGLRGDDLHRDSGKWMKKEREIDRANDVYREVVTDPETGKVTHRCEEPLSKHTGHGSAKRGSHNAKQNETLHVEPSE